MSTVIIGMDPHKRSATIEVMATDERVLGGGRYGTDAAGYAAMLAGVRRWPQRTWAIEGCQGIGRHLAGRLVAAGEQVVDVPPKLSARTRVFSAGQGRKTDAIDAHSVALAATRMTGLRRVTDDARLAVLRVLADRRRALGEDHTRMISQLHQLLLELIPGGAKKALSAAQAKALLARVRPRDPAGRARRRVAAELISDLERIYQRKKAADKELTAALKATATTLTSLDGIGPSGAARLLVEAGDITRFPSKAHFASWERDRADRCLLRGPCPAPAVPRGEPADQPHAAHHGRRPAPPPHQGPRLLRPQGRRRETPMEAMRALKRRLSDVVYRQMIADARAAGAGPGGHTGAATGSSAAGSDPITGASEKSHPRPATCDLTPANRSAFRAAPAPSNPGRAAVTVKRPVLDGDEDRPTMARREQPPT